MKQHTSSLSTSLALVSEPSAESLPDPRERLAALVALGFERCPAPMVARRLDRGQSTVYGWAQPGLVGGLRALDLLTAPRPFSRLVVRGLGLALDGGGPPDGPSRSSLAAVLARVAGLLLVVERESPEGLSDQQLSERLRSLDEAELALRRERQRYDLEALRRKVAAQKGEG